MHTIRRADIAAVCNVSICSVPRWIAKEDTVRRSTENHFHRYHYTLGGVVRGLRKSRKRGLSAHEARALAEIDRTRRGGEEAILFVGDGPRERAQALTAVLTDVEKERLKLAQAQFTGALVAHLLDRNIFERLDHLRDVLILSPDVLYFVLTGDATDGLNWPNFAPAFAVVNVPADVLYDKEAA